MNIKIKIDRSTIERHSTVILDPGPDEIEYAGDDIRDLVDSNIEDGKKLNVGQAERLQDLITDGLNLILWEDGGITISEE